jgi:hypothetical protein
VVADPKYGCHFTIGAATWFVPHLVEVDQERQTIRGGGCRRPGLCPATVASGQTTDRCASAADDAP